MTSTQHLHQALAACLTADVPVLLWGAPGCGKTSTVEAFAAANGWYSQTIIASLYDPTDFSGLPVLQPDGTVRHATPSWAVRLAESGNGLLFLDEITTATPAVQNVMFRIVLNRTVGDYPLGRTRVVAAANTAAHNAGAYDLSAPLANRFCHLDWALDLATFTAGLGGSWPAVPAGGVPDDWEDHVPAVAARISGFLATRPDLLLEVPGAGPCQGWPSPRSWAAAVRLLAACHAAAFDEEVCGLVLAGVVGEGPALEARVWFERDDLPDPAAVLADPCGADLPTRADALYATLASITTLVSSRPELWAAAFEVVRRVAETAPDQAVRAAQALTDLRPAGTAIPAGIGALAPVLERAGLLEPAA